MRHILEHEVAGALVVGIWDDVLDRGRIIWQGGQAFDLVRPRDNTYIDRILVEGGTRPEVIEGVDPVPEVSAPEEQLSLW